MRARAATGVAGSEGTSSGAAAFRRHETKRRRWHTYTARPPALPRRFRPGVSGSPPPARGGPAPLPGIQDDGRAAWPAGAPGRVPRALPVTAPYCHGAFVTQPRVVSSPGATLGAPPLGHARRLPPGLPAPAVGSYILGSHASPPLLYLPTANHRSFLARWETSSNRGASNRPGGSPRPAPSPSWPDWGVSPDFLPLFGHPAFTPEER